MNRAKRRIGGLIFLFFSFMNLGIEDVEYNFWSPFKSDRESKYNYGITHLSEVYDSSADVLLITEVPLKNLKNKVLAQLKSDFYDLLKLNKDRYSFSNIECICSEVVQNIYKYIQYEHYYHNTNVKIAMQRYLRDNFSVLNDIQYRIVLHETYIVNKALYMLFKCSSEKN